MMSCAARPPSPAGPRARSPTGEVLLAQPDERLPDVAQRMLEHGTSHAVVVEPRTGRPVGVLSTLDIAGILGWGLG
jgi:CBS domain-containing protein